MILHKRKLYWRNNTFIFEAIYLSYDDEFFLKYEGKKEKRLWLDRIFNVLFSNSVEYCYNTITCPATSIEDADI
jgi:hypothetical protein